MEAHSAGPGTERLETARFFAMDLLNLLLILTFCGILGYLRWVKLATLVSGDTPRWLFEAQRVGAGQAPYRDFSWQYPPFSVLLFGWAMRWFGVTFAVAQVLLDAISLAIVLAGFSLARLLLPRFLLLPTMFCFVASYWTSLTFFNLFSLLTYIPALQISIAGFLFFLLGVLSYVRTGELKASVWLLISSGAFVASYGKPETLFATFTTLLFLAILDRNYWFEERKITDWLLHYAKLCAACSVPAVVAYVWSGTLYGYSDMFTGISGYGLAKAQCPWWPTGLGVFGAASSLGEVLFIVSALSLTRQKYFAARFGYFYYYTLAAGLCGACVYFAYVYYNNHELLSGNRSLLEKIWYSGQSTFWTSA